ncbi:hypothetical protein vseg_017217 [Gypsophila vaccaria]
MVCLQQSFLHCTPHTFLPQVNNNGSSWKKVSFLVKAEAQHVSSQDRTSRRKLLALGSSFPGILLFAEAPISFAAESRKGFLSASDKKDGYEFLYPFGWQEVAIDGQDKAFKDVIEPLESVSVNIVPTAKQDIREFGAPNQVAETLIKKVLAPPTQKTKLIQAKEHEADGKTYYTFEFTAQAPNYTRHALSAICINNGKFYTLTTGANERRWGKMKDRLNTVIDSFRVFKESSILDYGQ